jgi:hypothetical protein
MKKLLFLLLPVITLTGCATNLEPSAFSQIFMGLLRSAAEIQDAHSGVTPSNPQPTTVTGWQPPVKVRPTTVMPDGTVPSYTDGLGHYYYPNGSGYNDQNGVRYNRSGPNTFDPVKR